METAPLHQLFEDYLLPLDMGHTSKAFLKEFFQPDTSVGTLGEIIYKNQCYRHHFVRIANELKSKSKWGKDEPKKEGEETFEINQQEVERIVGWFGKLGSRNYLLDLRILRSIEDGFPTTKEGELKTDPAKNLLHAIKAEEFCESKRMAHPEHAYLGGLLWDWLFRVSAIKNPAHKEFQTALPNIWKNALCQAVISHQLGQKIDNLPFNEFLFSASLGLSAGKLLMSILFQSNSPSWKDHSASMEAFPFVLDPYLETRIEKKKFGFSHNEIASLIFRFFTPMNPIEKAIFYYPEPHYLKTTAAKLYPLSVIMGLSYILTLTKGDAAARTNTAMRFAAEGLKKYKITIKDLNNAVTKIKGIS